MTKSQIKSFLDKELDSIQLEYKSLLKTKEVMNRDSYNYQLGILQGRTSEILKILDELLV